MKTILSFTLAVILGLGVATFASAAAAGTLSYEDLFAKAQIEIISAQQMGIPSRFATGLLDDSKVAYAAGDRDKARALAKKALKRAQTAQHFAAQQRRAETAS